MTEHPRETALARALVALEGLSCGDAFGENFSVDFADSVESPSETRSLPSSPWHFTDDTLMACSVFSVLARRGEIDQNLLANSFAENYDSGRGYGAGMHRLLNQIRGGEPWREAASSLFNGQGSFGNGSAMRVAPLGAYFADDLDRVAEQAELSSVITHKHPEAVAGAIAVAVSAALAWNCRNLKPTPAPDQFLCSVLRFVPESKVRSGIASASCISPNSSVLEAVSILGNGAEISAPDTVPFALWCAAKYLHNYEESLLSTARGGGDVDTNCAIVGGIVVLNTGTNGIPNCWRSTREQLPVALVGQ